MRRFIRHPTDIPLEFTLENVVADKRDYLTSVSHGGLSFMSDHCIETGTIIDVRIPLRDPVFEARAVVVWCSKGENNFEVGVRFEGGDKDYRLRMVEQVCYIEHYKRETREREGRELTGEQAALEWIAKYGRDFPR